MTKQILALRDHLVQQRATCVVMEATGDCWKPFDYLLEDLSEVEVMFVNARHVEALPGRKSDVCDAAWLAQLAAHGRAWLDSPPMTLEVAPGVRVSWLTSRRPDLPA